MEARVVTIDANAKHGAANFRGETAGIIHDHGSEKTTFHVHVPIKSGGSGTVRTK